MKIIKWNSNIYQPYSYLVYHIPTNFWYYGIQYQKRSGVANPSNLWNDESLYPYYTSSKRIKELINLYGKDSFKISIRKLHNNQKEAEKWEQKLIKRVIKKRGNINGNCAGIVTNLNMIRITNGTIEKMIYKTDILPDGFYRGRITTGKIRVNNGTIEILTSEDNIPEGFVKGRLTKGKICVNNGIIEKVVFADNIPKNFIIGRLIGERVCVNNGKHDILVNPNKIPDGYIIGSLQKGNYIYNNGENEVKCKPNEAPDGYVKGCIKIICPFCGKEGSGSNMKRYHFDKCKNK